MTPRDRSAFLPYEREPGALPPRALAPPALRTLRHVNHRDPLPRLRAQHHRGDHLMPKFTSQAQRAAFAIAAEHPEKSRSGIPQAVAQRALAEDAGGKLPSKAQRGASMAQARIRALRARRGMTA